MLRMLIPIQPLEQQPGCSASHLMHRLLHNRLSGMENLRQLEIIEADQCRFFRNF